MSQDTVLRLLEKSKKPLSTKQIADKLKLNRSTVNSNVLKMLRQPKSPIGSFYKNNYSKTKMYFAKK